jgi:hypothetical protein
MAGKPSGDGIVEKDVNRRYIQQFGKSCAKIVEKLMKSDDRREGPEELVTPCATPGEESPCKSGTQVLDDGGHDLRNIRTGGDNRKKSQEGQGAQMPKSATSYIVGSEDFGRQILKAATDATGKPNRSRAIRSAEPAKVNTEFRR